MFGFQLSANRLTFVITLNTATENLRKIWPMPEVYFHRKAVTYRRAKAILSRLFSINFQGFQTFVYESTSEPLTGTTEDRFLGNFSWVHGESGLWNLLNLIPRSKSSSSLSSINSQSKISDPYFLDIYARVSYLLVSDVDYKIVKKVISSDFKLGIEIEGIESANFVIYSVDTDAPDLETGIAEEVVSSDSVSRDILSILGIQ